MHYCTDVQIWDKGQHLAYQGHSSLGASQSFCLQADIYFVGRAPLMVSESWSRSSANPVVFKAYF
jgi:hypothetical protein